MDHFTAGHMADDLIASEVGIQDKMWGSSNERADALENQMPRAAMAQLDFIIQRDRKPDHKEAVILELSQEYYYPKDWDGFRSYGSTIANLVVAAAYIRSEIKRRVMAGEDATRTKRGEPYVKATPFMSSEDAADHHGE